MDIKYIKVGETYNVRVRVVLIEPNRIVCRPLNQDGTPSDFCPNYFNFAEAEAFYPVETVTKSAKNAQKYDQNRKFRKGDIVEMDTHGRDVAASLKKAGIELGKRYTVTEDESNTGQNTGYVSFIGDDGIEHRSMFFWLKLVTPVEELEPYIVVDAHTHWDVADKNMKTVAMYSKGNHPHAKEAAEAERDRLNAEYRKEKK